MKNVQKTENVSEEIKTSEKAMTITKDQAKYWYSVAKKDLSDGNREGAWNVLRWLRENNAWFHANMLERALRNSA